MNSGRARRRMRQSGYAALAFAALQLYALPLPLHRAAVDVAWLGDWTTVVNVGVSVLLALLALRGSPLAAALIGAYGVYRVALFGLAIIRVLDGTAAAGQWGPAWVLASTLVVPFAVFWVRGGLAAFAVLRTRGGSSAAAI